MKLRFTALIMLSLQSFGAHAASDDNLRVHYHFLRGSIAGQNEFAASLRAIRQHMDVVRAKPFDTNESVYQKSLELIQINPKVQRSSESAGKAIEFIKELSEQKYPNVKSISTALSSYSLATGYLTSGPMRAPRYYESLGMKSEKELSEFRSDIISVVTRYNSGRLNPEELKSLDLIFKYYTGISISVNKDSILSDPIMFPVKEAENMKETIRVQIRNDLKKLTDTTRNSVDILTSINNKINAQIIHKSLKEAPAKIYEAKSYSELDQLFEQYTVIQCSGINKELCEIPRDKVLQLVEQRKEVISRTEFTHGIDQSIQLGIQIAVLTGDKNLGRTFKALKAASDAYNAVNAGVSAFSSASTTMGQVGAVAGAMTGVVGAAIVISSLMDKGPNADQLMMESLRELKSLVLKLSDQIEAGFAAGAQRTDRIEALLKSYSNLASKNDSTLQQEILALRDSIREGLQPLENVRLSYAEKSYEQFRNISEKSIAVLLTLPKSPTMPLPDETKKHLTSLFSHLFAIVSSIEKGEYKAFVGPTQAADAHLAVLNQLAAYPPSDFRTAFLMQNAINAARHTSCTKVNLLGFLMVSEASEQVNLLLDELSHFQIGNYLYDTNVNFRQLLSLLNVGTNYITDQRAFVRDCISTKYYIDFEKDQLNEIVQLIQNQKNSFFSDGDRLNDMIITAAAKYPVPGGFHRDSFFVGQLIQNTQSFDPEVWDRNSFLPTVLPIYDLGTKGFQITRKDYEGFIPTYQVRLGPNVGADFQLYVENYWTPLVNVGWAPPRNLNPFPLQIALTSPRSRKLIMIWTGRVFPNWLTDPSLYDERAVTTPPIPTAYYRLRADSLPRVYEMLNAREIGLLGTMDFQYGNREPWFKATPQHSAANCNVSDGFYSCPKLFRGDVNYFRFVQGHYFSGPTCIFRDGANRCDSGSGARGVSLDRESQFYNPYRKEFADGMINYVRFLSEVVQSNLSKCLLNLVQGKSFTCKINEHNNIYVNKSDAFRNIEKYNLLRLTLDFGSDEMQRLARVADVSEIGRVSVPDGADAAIRKIELYVRGLKTRLDELAAPAPVASSDLPRDLNGLLENRHDWLALRLSAHAMD
jgi:hypothetical protein